MHWTAGVTGVALLLVLSACGGDSSPTPSSSFEDVAERLVADALLSVSDLPTGWEEVAAGYELTNGADLLDDCDVFDLDVTFAGAVVTESSKTYEGLREQQVASFAGVYREDWEAASAVSATRETLDRCEDEFRDVVRSLAEDRLEALGIDLGFLADIDVNLGERQGAGLGDSSAAYRMEVKVGLPGADQRFTLDVLVISEGRVGAAMTYATFGSPDEEEEAEIARSLLDNSAAVEAQLPPTSERSVAQR
jgi:hypothetical protein